MADVLGTLILLTVPNFNPVVVERIQMQVAGCGVIDDGCCMPPPLKIVISPTVVTLRLEDAQLLRFGLSFDRRERPVLWPLEAELARVRRSFPDLTTVQLEVDDDVELGLLIAVADLCIGAGYPNVIAAPDSSSP